MLCTMAVGLYTSRVVLNTLGVIDFGVYNVVGGIITIFSFINNSMSTASSRFITFELGTGNKNKLKNVFGQSLSIHLLIAILIIILGETIGLWFIYEKIQIPTDRFSSALIVYHLSIAASCLSIMSVPYNAAIIAHEKMSAFAYITILDVILKLGIVYLLIIFPYDKLIVYAILLLIVQIINQGVYLFYSYRQFEETKTWFSWDSSLFKEMSSFAGWSLFGNFSITLYNQGVNILLNIFFGPIMNTARGISMQVQNIILRFISSFQTSLNPQITKSYAQHDYKEMHKLIFMSSKFSFYLMLFLSLPIFLNTEYILKLWLNVVPNYSTIFVQLLLIIALIETLINPLTISIQATGKIRTYQILVGGTLLSILPLSWIALKFNCPPYTVYIIQIICSIIALFIRLYFIRKNVGISIKEYLKKVIARISIVFISSLLLTYLISHYFEIHSLYALIFESLLIFISLTCIIYILGLNKKERKLIKGVIKSKINKQTEP